jgi:hypothetical protein
MTTFFVGWIPFFDAMVGISRRNRMAQIIKMGSAEKGGSTANAEIGKVVF